MTDHKELRRLAAAATQGNWGICPETDGTELVAYEVPWKVLAVVCKMPLYPGTNNWYANFAFISKANPKAVTALLDELDQAAQDAEHDRNCWEANVTQFREAKERAEKAVAERDQLRGQLAEEFAKGAREGWMLAHVYNVDIDAEADPEVIAQMESRWPLATPLPAAATFGDNDPGPGPHVDGQSPEWKATHILPDSVQVRTPE